MITAAGTGSDRRRAVRQKIMETAERLYATCGIDGVSLRQINQAAGQRNESAVQYHFGSRERLIDAIMAHRTEAADARRLALVDGMIAVAGGSAPDRHEIAGAIVMPMFDDLQPGGLTFHRRFVRQIHQQHELMRSILVNRHDRGLRRCLHLIRQGDPAMPVTIHHHRYIHAVALAVDAAANLEESIQVDAERFTRRRIAFELQCCVDSVTGVLGAPVSRAASDLLDHPDEELARLRERAAL